ncbi:WD40 repeat-containing protein [Handroanthus impetiginosus]|uniref:WD40 repeat-containing protein n=1 Tax=Handroanthus impetiginosus TaxID=429701 RepID=A0A2G9HIT9_9LAMI|nr:WD40 repeat-containing protein [Handroanthus impetiginosus]
MGGPEDNEPPSKRVKAYCGESGSLSDSVSLREQGSCSLCDSMAWLLVSQGGDEIVGSKGIIKKNELVRIIAETLYSLGYAKTGAHLEEESGIPLHSPAVDLFLNQIREGRWDESISMLHEIGLLDETMIKLASFLILEQKFFELLDGEKVMDALKTLRTEIAPLCVDDEKVQELSSFMLSPSQNSDSGKVRLRSRTNLVEELHKVLPPTVMIPEKRLVHLVEQALDLQKEACRFHNSSDGKMSLLTDHQCGRDHIPSQTLQILQEHSDEVWFLQFSHNGKYLASSSGDCLVIIWEVMADGQVSLKHRLSGHQKPVFYITWSHDDNQLLTCGVEEAIRRWDIASGECLHIYEKTGIGLISCAWAPDGKSIFSGGTDKSIIIWDVEGKELECWKGQRTIRIADVGITNRNELITVCKEKRIQMFELETQTEKFIEEDETITSFALSEDSKFLLVSLLNEELHLWNIDGCIKLVAKYKGHKRSRFVVRSCFGGLEQAFIASGSEDSQVYIWLRVSGELILTLAGHSGAVNCVSWNPANPYMLASASDDRTIRIWGLNQVNMDHNGRHSNGVHCCNGGT